MKNNSFKIILSFFIVIIINCSMYSQKDTIKVPEFSDLMENSENTFYDIQGNILKHPEIYENLSPKMKKRYNRWEYWWSSRVGENGSFRTANEEFLKYIKNEKSNYSQKLPQGFSPCESLCLDPGISTSHWESLGPKSYPIGNDKRLISQGKINKVWMDPNHSNILYAGADTGGLWKTENGGDNWVCLTDDVPLCGVMDFLIDPNDPDVIYIATWMHANGTLATGFDFMYTYSQGILKSTNGGASWNVLNTGAPVEQNAFYALVMHPTNSNIIYALASRTVYRTTNGGLSWVDLNVPDTDPDDQNPMGTGLLKDGHFGFFNMVMDPNNPNTIYISGHQLFYKTTDGGVSWTNLHTISSFQNLAYSRTQISIDFVNNTLYALIYNNKIEYNGSKKVIKSMDGGLTWNVISTSVGNAKVARWVSIIKVSPSGDIYAGGIFVKRKPINSTSWVNLGIAHDDVRHLSFPNPNNSSIVLRTDDGGVWESDNKGKDWTNISGNIAANQCYNIAYSESNPDFYMIGVQDGGSYYYNSGVWSLVNHSFGDGGLCLIDYDDNDIRYFQKSSYLQREDNSGTHSCHISTYRCDGPFLIHPTNHETLYAGREKRINNSIYRYVAVSYDKGDNWSIFGLNDHQRVYAMDISKTNPDIFYYTNTEFDFNTYPWTPTVYMWRTINNGASWEQITLPPGIYDSGITEIKIHPTNSSMLWITYGNFSNGNKVFESYDKGQTWTNISDNLPNIPIQCLEIDPRNNQIYIGTDVGVFSKCIDAQEWTLLTGIPRVIISDLQINSSSGELLASTYGRGTWKISLNNYCNPPSTQFISSNQTWTGTRALCGDLEINSGTLTILGHVTMPIASEIRVNSGGTLILDGNCAIIKYANIIAESGSHIKLKNGGTFQRASDDEFEIKNGAIFDVSYGEIKDISQ